MSRQRTTIPAPRPVLRVAMADGCVRMFSARDELVLAFQDEQHLEEFLAAFGEAWMRWDEREDESDSLLDELQQTLPF